MRRTQYDGVRLHIAFVFCAKLALSLCNEVQRDASHRFVTLDTCPSRTLRMHVAFILKPG